jgi:uncharacterized protein involved in outer membrane biogenesis
MTPGARRVGPRRRLAFALALAVLAILAALGALVLPGLLDWNRYRPEIAAYASESLGRDVRIDGPVSLTLLPEPVLTAGKVSLSTPGSENAGRMTAAELRLRVTLRGLLAGRLEARELVLRGMDLRLPWPLPPAALVIRTPAWLSALSARVEKGRLRIGALDLTDIDATLSTVESTGTWRVGGTATEAGRSWRFAVQLTQPGGDGSEGLDASFDGEGPAKGLGATVSGQIAAGGAFGGRIAFHGNDLALLLPAPSLPFRAEGRLTVDKGLAAADDLSGDLGGTPMQGAVALRFTPVTRLDLALTANRLDLDAWWTALTKPRPASTLLPTIGIDLSTEAAQLAGGTIRTLRAGFDLVPGAVELRELRAELPGEASLRAAGRLTLPAAKAPASFNGYFALTAPAPRATLAWIAPTLAPPDGTLRSLALAAHVVADPTSLAADNIDGTLDDTTLAGSLALAAGARRGIKADLRLGDVNATPWLGLGDRALWLKLLAATDADLHIEAASLAAGAFRLDHVALEAASAAGKVEVKRFDAGLTGAHLAAQGALLDGTRLADVHLRLDGTADALRTDAMLPFWPEHVLAALPGGAPIWQAPLSLDLAASGALPALALKLTARLGDLDADAAPSIDLAAGKWSATLTLRHPGAPRLLEALGLPGASAWLGEGSLGLVAQLQGQPGRIAAERFDLAAGAMHASGALTLAEAGNSRTIGGRVDFDTLALPAPDPRSTTPMPQLDLAGWQGGVDLSAVHVLLGRFQTLADARGRLVLGEGGVRLDGIQARLAGGTLAASAAFDTAASPPALTLRASLGGVAAARLTESPIEVLSGTLDASLDLRASGYAPSALLATLAGSASMSWHDGVLDGVNLAALSPGIDDSTVQAALGGGSTRFGRLDVALGLAGGLATLDHARLEGPAGTIEASGTVDLIGAREDLHLVLVPPIADPPRIGLRLSGPVSAPTRTPDLAALIRWRATHPP